MPSRFVLLLSLVTCLFFSTPGAAHAGHWAVSYTYTFTHDGQTTSATDVGTAPAFGGGGAGSLTLVVTATINWTPDSPQDTSPPPAKVSYIENGHAQIQAVDTLTPVNKGLANINTTASNGLGDDPVPFTPSPPQYGDTSDGAHLTQAQGAPTIVLQTRTLSANLTYDANSDPANGGFVLRYSVIFGNGSLEGHSTADTAGWDPTNPRFFSGTACTAKGVAAALSGNVSHAQLCIGENGSDTPVNEYFDGSASGTPGAASVPLNAMFDSTHFKDGAEIKLTLKVWDTNGGHYEVEATGPAYNKASLLTNSGDTSTFNNVPNENTLAAQLQSRDNYTAHASQDAQKMDILNSLPQLTAFYIDTHGGAGTFGDCGYVLPGSGVQSSPIGPTSGYFLLFAGSAGNDQDSVGQPTISKKVRDKNSAYPPFNFVFVNACDTSSDEQIPGAFLGGGAMSDRAELGFVPTIAEDTALKNWVSSVWDNLTNGHTILDSVIAANADYQPNGVNLIPSPAGTVAWDPNPAHEFPTTGKISGDKAMKLHTVYGGNSYVLLSGELPGSWYRLF